MQPKSGRTKLLTYGAGVLFLLASAVLGAGGVFCWQVYTANRNGAICRFPDAFGGLLATSKFESRLRQAAGQCRLVRKDERGLQLWATPVGQYWFPASTAPIYIDYVAAQWSGADAYDGAPVRPGDVVLDCGGFVGDYARKALLAGASHVVTIEPAADTVECIRRNLATEIAAGKVTLCAKGVWDKEDRLFLGHDPTNPAANSVVGKAPSGEWVPLTTIDHIVAEAGLKRVDVIKMDVEGAETRALLGARETIGRFHPRLAVATEHTDNILTNSRAVVAAMRQVDPSYRAICGLCRWNREVVSPETIFFVPPGQ